MDEEALARLAGALGIEGDSGLPDIARWHGEAAVCAVWERVGHLPVEARSREFFRQIREMKEARKRCALWPISDLEAWSAAVEGRRALDGLVPLAPPPFVVVGEAEKVAAREAILAAMRETPGARMSGSALGQILARDHGPAVGYFGNVTRLVQALVPELRDVGRTGHDVVWELNEPHP